MVLRKKILQEALAQAKVARKQIMANMMDAIAAPRDELSPYAPKVQMMKIEPDQIKAVIGQGVKQSMKSLNNLMVLRSTLNKMVQLLFIIMIKLQSIKQLS